MKIALYSSTPRQGKTTIADYLQREKGYFKFSFADPIRATVRGLLAAIGLPDDSIAHYEKEKEDAIPLVGCSFRCLCRVTGTDFGRSLIKDSIWTDAARSILVNNSHQDIVCDDLRFEDEYALLKSLNFVTINIVKPVDLAEFKLHSSDGRLMGKHFDFVVLNDGSVSELYDQIDGILRAGVSGAALSRFDCSHENFLHSLLGEPLLHKNEND